MNFFGLIDIPAWILLIIFLIVLFMVYTTATHGTFSSVGIPGPPPGFWGIITEYRKRGFGATDVYLVQKYGRLVGLFHAREPILLVADTDVVKEICIKQFDKFMNRKEPLSPTKEESLFVGSAKDEHWKFTRGVLSPSFSSGKIKKMIPLMIKCTENLIENLKEKAEKGEEFEMRSFISCFTLDVIGSVVFGIEIDSQKDQNNLFVQNAKKALNFSFTSPTLILSMLFPGLGDIFAKFGFGIFSRSSKEFFVEAVSQVMKDKLNDPQKRDDLMQMMMTAEEESHDQPDFTSAGVKKEFGDLDVIYNGLLFLVAGFDTTSNTLSFIAYHLATHPDLQDKLIQEIDFFVGKGEITNDNLFNLQYLERFINETLRIFPAALRVTREAGEDIQIRGHKIPRGTTLAIAIYAIHHDPEYWDEPEVFDPDRFLPSRMGPNPFCFLPFGMGPRNCIGMRFAMTEIKVAVVSMLQHYKFLTSPSTQIPVKLDKKDIFLRAEKGNWLKVEAR